MIFRLKKLFTFHINTFFISYAFVNVSNKKKNNNYDNYLKKLYKQFDAINYRKIVCLLKSMNYWKD